MKGIELDKDAIFRRIGYVPHEGQARIHASKAKRRSACCGARWGKSEAAAAEVVYASFEPREKGLIWVVAPTLDLCDRIFVRVLNWILTYFKHRVLSYEKRERTIVVRNLGGGATTVKAKTTDAPAGLLGEAVDLLVVDECIRITDNVWFRYLAPRLIDRKGSLFAISTAGSKGWFYSEWRRGQKGRDPECESFSGPTIENPFIDPATVEAERARMPEEAFATEYLAQFVNVESEPCDVCGGPSPSVTGCVTLLEGETLRYCEECRYPVDAEGKTLVALWPNNEPYISIIELRSRPKAAPPVPGQETESESEEPESGLMRIRRGAPMRGPPHRGGNGDADPGVDGELP